MANHSNAAFAAEDALNRPMPSLRIVDDTRPLALEPTEPSGHLARGTSLAAAPGDKIDRYRVIGPIGAGGMGAVYLADDPRLDRRVALKLVRRPQGNGSPADLQERLLREAMAMARVRHDHVVAVHDAGVFEGRVYIVMEHIHGETAREWSRGRNRGWREQARVALEAGRGLAACHAAGICHRDVKPSNIVVGEDGRARLIDFGVATSDHWARSDLSKPLLRDADTITPSGATMGTPAYMAPEQLDGVGSDERSDQYSFFLTLFELVYGVAAFPQKTVIAMTKAKRAGRLHTPPKDAKVPNRVREIIERGLSPNPTDRFASMDEALDALQRAIQPTLIEQALEGLGILGSASLGALRHPR